MTEDAFDAVRPEFDRGLRSGGLLELAERGANFSSGGSSICMGVSLGHRPGRETTRAHLERIGVSSRFGGEVMGSGASAPA